jgi:NDP-sugar pyrophosphorylase family protein
VAEPSDNSMPMVCILAGGLGTRLGELVKTTPKPLIEVAGEPFVLHQLRLLASFRVAKVVMCVGYLGELIEERLGSNQFGIEIAYSYDSPGLDGTLGAIRRAVPQLSEQFLFLYGDTYLQIDYADVAATWVESAQPAIMTVLRNAGRWDVSNARVRDGMVVAYDKRQPTPAMEWIDYGLGGLSVSTLGLVPPEATDLSELQTLLAANGLLKAYEATERFYEIGTPVALGETDQILRELYSDDAGADEHRPRQV